MPQVWDALDTSESDVEMTGHRIDHYGIEVRIWRDEQPGDDPVLYVSALFTVRDAGSPWSRVRLVDLRLRAEEAGEWIPVEATLEPLEGGAFQIKGSGKPTIEAGAVVVLIAALDTADGRKNIEVPGTVVELVE